MKASVKEYFNFTKRERNGTIILLIIIVILLIISNTMFLFGNDKNYDYSNFEAEIDSFFVSLESKDNEEYISRLDQYIIDRYDTLELFKFNPNTIDSEDWLKLGLTEKQIGTINNYLSKGGKFYDKKDFQKMYGIRTKQYQILKPYIDLPESSSYKKNYKKNYDNNYKKYDNKKEPVFETGELFEFNPNMATEADWQKLGFSEKQSTTFVKYTSKGGKFYKKEDLLKIYGVEQEHYDILEPYIILENSYNNENEEVEYENVIVEINSATQSELTQIKGIGDYYAGRMLKYRDLLGGYSNKEQLLEVYGMKPEVYEKIKDNIEINTEKITKIKINFANKKDLAKHPYIDYETAKKITNYRNKNGAYKSLNTLIDKNIISQEIFDKISPYIKI